MLVPHLKKRSPLLNKSLLTFHNTLQNFVLFVDGQTSIQVVIHGKPVRRMSVAARMVLARDMDCQDSLSPSKLVTWFHLEKQDIICWNQSIHLPFFFAVSMFFALSSVEMLWSVCWIAIFVRISLWLHQPRNTLHNNLWFVHIPYTLSDILQCSQCFLWSHFSLENIFLNLIENRLKSTVLTLVVGTVFQKAWVCCSDAKCLQGWKKKAMGIKKYKKSSQVYFTYVLNLTWNHLGTHKIHMYFQ